MFLFFFLRYVQFWVKFKRKSCLPTKKKQKRKNAIKSVRETRLAEDEMQKFNLPQADCNVSGSDPTVQQTIQQRNITTAMPKKLSQENNKISRNNDDDERKRVRKQL